MYTTARSNGEPMELFVTFAAIIAYTIGVWMFGWVVGRFFTGV